MKKTNFKKFPIGTVFNTVTLNHEPKLTRQNITIKYPSRLEAMALDPAKIADNNNLIYKAGQVNITIALYKTIRISITNTEGEVVVTKTSPRQALILHSALIMKQALNIKEGLQIDVIDTVNLRHCGLGSSSSLIAGVAAAINELYGKPLSALDIVRYCAQNHGEEIDGDNYNLIPVQCIGGSGVCGNFEGGLIILAGQATPIYATFIPKKIKVVIGIPSDFEHPDSKELMQAEVDNMEGFRTSGKEYSGEIAYRLVHDVLPGLQSGDLKTCKDLIFDYRWDMGSINNCSFVYPRMLEIAEALRPLKNDDRVKIISLSSVGPGFFALTEQPDVIQKLFESQGLIVHTTDIHNDTYQIMN